MMSTSTHYVLLVAGLSVLPNLAEGGVIRSAARTPAQQQQYLRRYGYLSSSSSDNDGLASLENGGSASTAQFSSAVRRFQHMAGIRETGTMTPETIRMMEMPRCGVADSMPARSKRYAIQGSKWPRNLLTYKFVNYTFDMPRTRIVSDLGMAFKLWSDVAMLSFSRRYRTADIDISFVAGPHLDGSRIGSFDGQGGTLAHAFYPRFGGDIHFDDDEAWTSGSTSGTNLLQVATHEIGHSLGLGHSDVRESIMAPFYTGYNANLMLHSDDISGVRSIYGTRMNTGSRDKRSTP